jgi:hypothetical protein
MFSLSAPPSVVSTPKHHRYCDRRFLSRLYSIQVYVERLSNLCSSVLSLANTRLGLTLKHVISQCHTRLPRVSYRHEAKLLQVQQSRLIRLSLCKKATSQASRLESLAVHPKCSHPATPFKPQCSASRRCDPKKATGSVNMMTRARKCHAILCATNSCKALGKKKCSEGSTGASNCRVGKMRD